MTTEETCRGCGRTLLTMTLAGVNVRLEADALDAQEATRAIFSGSTLWTVIPGRSAAPAKADTLSQLTAPEWMRPHIVQEHRCVPATAPFTDARPQEPSEPLREPLTGTQRFPADLSPTTPSARPTHPSGASPAGDRRSDETPHCSVCGNPCPDPATRVMFHLGATLIDAFHAECS